MNGGNGTMAPSYALAEYFSEKGENAKVFDIMNEANPLGEILGNIYNYLLRHNIYYASMYMNFAHRFPIDNFQPYNQIGRNRTAKLIDSEQPDAIVMICPWISKMVIQAVNISMRKKETKPLLVTNIVDLGEKMATSWINNDVDLTVLPTTHAEKYLSKHGLDLNKSKVLGVPLHKEFSMGEVKEKEKLKARNKYGIDEKRTVISILGGREGVCNTKLILMRLMRELHDYDYFVQCGLNRKLYTKIDNVNKTNKNVHPLGFIDSMRELYALSDVVITKAGAITVSELTASNVPFILDTCPSIMPQEYGNIVFVRENELGLIANTIDEIPALVRRLVEDRSQMAKQNDIRRNIYGTEKIGELIIKTIKKR